MATVPTPLTYKFTRASGVTTVEINNRVWFAVAGATTVIIKPVSFDSFGAPVNFELRLIGFAETMRLEPGNYIVNGVDRTSEGMASVINWVLADAFLGA